LFAAVILLLTPVINHTDAIAPETMASSHLANTSNGCGAAVELAARRQVVKYVNFNRGHHFLAIDIKSVGSFQRQ